MPSTKKKKKLQENASTYSLPADLIVLKNADGSLVILNGSNDQHFFQLHGKHAIDSFEWLCEGRPVSWIIKKVLQSTSDFSESEIGRELKALLTDLLKNKILIQVK